MGPIRNPRWEQKRTEGYVIVSKTMVVVDFCCFGSCLFVKNFGTKPGHHAVTSFTKPGLAILTCTIRMRELTACANTGAKTVGQDVQWNVNKHRICKLSITNCVFLEIFDFDY